MLVPPDTVTESILRRSDAEQEEARAEGEVEIATWLGGQESLAAWEEVIGLGSYGRVLTVLTVLSCPEFADEDYFEVEDSDEALEESWTPRFRR